MSHRKPNYLPEETKDGGDSSNSELSPNCNLFTTCKRNTTKGYWDFQCNVIERTNFQTKKKHKRQKREMENDYNTFFIVAQFV